MIVAAWTDRLAWPARRRKRRAAPGRVRPSCARRAQARPADRRRASRSTDARCTPVSLAADVGSCVPGRDRPQERRGVSPATGAPRVHRRSAQPEGVSWRGATTARPGSRRSPRKPGPGRARRSARPREVASRPVVEHRPVGFIVVGHVITGAEPSSSQHTRPSECDPSHGCGGMHAGSRTSARSSGWRQSPPGAVDIEPGILHARERRSCRAPSLRANRPCQVLVNFDSSFNAAPTPGHRLVNDARTLLISRCR